MYSSKKEIDNHVRLALGKINSEKDRALRGLTIAKLYFKIKEYATAEQYICSYLGVKDDNDQAHKMLGQCYQYLKQPRKALQYFQRSLQLNPKQPDLLGDVCRLFVEDEEMNANTAKYWCELAESSKVENEFVYALRMKLLNQANVSTSEIESILRKEISTRPNDVNPRVRLVRHFLDQQQMLDAFKYVHDLELEQNEAFSQSSEWYNMLWLVLSKYEQLPDTKKDWDFWLLVAICLERLVFLSFMAGGDFNSNGSAAAVIETANLIFRFDQYLFKISKLSDKFQAAQREHVQLFLEHYRSQLVMHAVALIFKRELMQKKNKWRETLKLTLPLLLLAYHTKPKDSKEPWMKHCNEKNINLIQLWHREGSFRCAQAGRILLSCIADDNKENSNVEINSVFGTQSAALWKNRDELLAQVRQTCVDKQWRRNIFAQLFCNSDQKLKEQSSLLVKSPHLAEPIYELPSFASLEEFEETAQYLRPQSLRHIVYLYLSYGGESQLSQVSAKYFSGLNFSISNLPFCSGESLNQLDVDSYLYAAIIETQRNLQINREISECYSGGMNSSAACRPRILPFANVYDDLCNDEQINWWSIAYKVYKNLAKSDNAAQMRTDLQTGIEVVRGINGPKMDMMIVFKLGKIFLTRAKNVERKPVERSHLEARTEALYMHGLKMLKLHNRGVLEPFRKTFKYKTTSSMSSERELNEIAESAVVFISERMFKKSQYEELIDELNGVPLPFASYKQAEAYRKMEEANNTPKSAKQRYAERAVECLQQTLALLKSTKFDINHPLNATINSELKRSTRKPKADENIIDDYSFTTDAGTVASGGHNNSSTYEDAETEFFSPQLNRSRQDFMTSILAAAAASISPQKPIATAAAGAVVQNSEVEALVKQMVSTLTLVKEELVCGIKPEVLSMRQEIGSLKDKVSQLEDAMKKMRTSSSPPSHHGDDDAASNVLDELYIIEDALQNQLYPQQQAFSNMPGSANSAAPPPSINPNQFGGNGVMPCNQASSQRNVTLTPQQQQQQAAAVAAAAAAAAAASPFSMFNPNYALNYYAANPYMLAQQNSAAAANPLLAQRSQMGIPSYIDSSPGVNFNIPSASTLFPNPAPVPPPVPGAVPVPAPQTDGRSTNHLLNLLNLPSSQSTAPAAAAALPTLPPISTILGQSPAVSSSLIITTATPTPTSSLSATTGGTGTGTFNKALNNQPVEKGPPANVVITNSDPLPNPKNATQLQQQQPALSVTIPSHHIKQSLVLQQTPPELPPPVVSKLSIFGGNTTTSGGDHQSTAAAFTFGGNNAALSKQQDATSNFINSFSFKPAVEQALAAATATAIANDSDRDRSKSSFNESTLNELNRSLDLESAEYDPRPDFQPIIPLPDEIEVRTGEEDEEIMFCEHAKLFRFVDKEWKERGLGTLKILKGKDGLSRILMRRDQTHKICANHKITNDLQLKPKLEKNGHTWAAPDFADGEMKSEIFYVRFKLQEQAKDFQKVFEKAQMEEAEELLEKEKEQNETAAAPKPAPFGLAKSSAVTSFATSTPTSKTDGAPHVSSPAGDNKSKLNEETSISSALAAAKTTTTTTVNKPLFGGTMTMASKPPNATATTTAPSPFANFTFGMSTAAAQPFSLMSSAATTSSSSTSIASSTPFGSNLFGKSATSTTTSASAESIQSPFSVVNLKFPTTTFAVQSTTTTTSTGTNDKGGAAGEAATNQMNKSNAAAAALSDNEDEYVPTAQFNPVIPLPELVEVTTGEENYKQLFEHRAKILRFDKDTREWKERGIGNIKILQHKDDKDNVRLVMRREQIHKLCCNQRIYKDTEFKYAKTSQTSLQWVGHDYSDGELSMEFLTIRFKTRDICKNFYDIVVKAQSEMSNKAVIKSADDQHQDQGAAAAAAADKTITKENISNATSPTETKGFGDAFKPKIGSWTCNGCYIINTGDKLYCPSCDTPKDDTVPKKDATSQSPFAPSTNVKFNFGFSNSGGVQSATGAPTAPAIFGTGSTTNTFTFGSQASKEPASESVSSSTTKTASTTTKASGGGGGDFGDKFKPKPGSWSCSGCYCSNAADKIYCVACEAPKDSSIPKKETNAAANDNNKNILALSNPTQKFNFGFSAANSTSPPSSSSTQPLFGTSTMSKPSFTFSLQSKAMTSPATQDTGISLSAPFSLNKKEFTFTMNSKALDGNIPKFGSAGAGAGDTDAAADTADDSGHLHEEEENNAYFTPVIPLPDKIDVKTGEEDEDVLYQHRAKLYRFADGEWKERGIGDVKILRHKINNKLRVIMRRDQVHKICLNHALNKDVEYKSKDDKSWLFVVNDYSEGEVQLEKLSLRFKTKDIAEDFMNAVKSALSSADDDTAEQTAGGLNGHHDSNEKKPNNVNLASSTPPQPPPRTIAQTTKKTEINEKNNKVEKPKIKSKWPLVQPELKLPDSPSNAANNTSSLGGGGGNRSFSLKQSALAAAETPSPPTSSSKGNDTTTTKTIEATTSPVNFSFTAAFKENETAKPKSTSSSGGFLFGSSDFGNNTGNKFGTSIFGGAGGNPLQQPLFGQAPSIFGSLNASNASTSTLPGSQNDTKTGSGSGSETKFVFGEKPAAFAAPKNVSIFDAKSKPLFGGSGSSSDTSSIFSGGAAAKNTNPFIGTQSSIFSTSTSSGSNNNSNTSIFGSSNATTKESSIFGSGGGGGIAKEPSTTTTPTTTTTNNNNATSAPMKPFNFADLTAAKGNNLDFAALAAASTNNNSAATKLSEKPAGPGGFIGLTNQDAFSSFLKSSNAAAASKDANANNAAAADGGNDDEAANDENYDPHYDPIIPLPKEIVVSTGEEDEQKIFSERAVLFRFDADNKEWKERGVGEIKILQHTKTGRYRLLLRREQVHKLVLNFPITEGFKFNMMKNNPKSFLFIGMNFAESTEEGVYEKLAIRFKKVEIAAVFNERLNECLAATQQNQLNVVQ